MRRDGPLRACRGFVIRRTRRRFAGVRRGCSVVTVVFGFDWRRPAWPTARRRRVNIDLTATTVEVPVDYVVDVDVGVDVLVNPEHRPDVRSTLSDRGTDWCLFGGIRVERLGTLLVSA